jgi:hypothetical protein
VARAKPSAPPDEPGQRPRWIADQLGRGRAFRRLTDAEQKTVVDPLSRIVDYWLDAADQQAPFDEVVDAVDFPAFVADLIAGVFDAIVDASVRQMEAYGDLVDSVAKTVDRFVDDTITDDQARDYLLDTFPDVFAGAGANDGAVKRRPGAPKGRWRLALSLLGLPKTDGKPDADTGSKRLILATRRHLVRGRQQLLATMVLMGIQRIHDHDGRRPARFKLRLRYRAK